MMPSEPLLWKSAADDVCFWAEECDQIDTIDFSSYSSRSDESLWDGLAFAMDPTEEDYFTAIDKGLPKTEAQEAYLRRVLWWMGNDRIRREESGHLSERHLESLKEFALLLHEDEIGDRIMKAEVFRELSRFDDALRLLDFEFPPGYEAVLGVIRELALAENSKVAPILSVR
jgi:hypothetical protein